jgi:hypothetical protein
VSAGKPPEGVELYELDPIERAILQAVRKMFRRTLDVVQRAKAN